MAPASADLYITQKEAATILRCTERTASTSSGVAVFWIFSIWLMVALLRRAEAAGKGSPGLTPAQIRA